LKGRTKEVRGREGGGGAKEMILRSTNKPGRGDHIVRDGSELQKEVKSKTPPAGP